MANRADTAIRTAAGMTVIGLASIAGAISYSHMTELAHAHGETGWRAHAFPLSVDGIEIVASLVLLADKRAGRRSGRLAWLALIVGAGASFAANVAVGGSDWIGRAISGWPAFAFLLTIKLLASLFDHPGAPTAVQDAPDESGPDLAQDQARPPADVPAAPIVTSTSTDNPATTHGDTRTSDDDHGRTASGPRLRSERPPRATPTALDVSALVPAARDARDALAAHGTPLTRQALARQMRTEGHPVSTARASALLKAVTAPAPDARHPSDDAIGRAAPARPGR